MVCSLIVVVTTDMPLARQPLNNMLVMALVGNLLKYHACKNYYSGKFWQEKTL